MSNKVIFLDIDGVINSERTCYAYGSYPHDIQDKFFDEVAMSMIRRLCADIGANIVLSSSWRYHHDYRDLAKSLQLPIIDATATNSTTYVPRGVEIQEYLDCHPHITHYVIVDDNTDMLPSQQDNFVQTSTREGLTFKNVMDMKSILEKQ